MTQSPLWDGTGIDPFLPARLAAESALTAAERRMYNSWWGSFSSWLVKVRRGVMSGVAPDPHAVWAAAPLWAAEMDAFVAGAVAETVGITFRNLFGADYAYDARPAVTTYLAQVRNRMVRTPEDVYSVVAGEVAKGAGAGESIPDIAARVDKVLSTTGTENWRGRAVTVARTEAIGALNAGRADAHVAVADALGGEFEQVWLSTIDRRTRPDHAEADQQRVPVGTPFTVCGEQLMFPGWPGGSAGCVINCRCSSLLERAGEKTDLTGRGFSDADEWWANQLGTPPAAKAAPASKRKAARELAPVKVAPAKAAESRLTTGRGALNAGQLDVSGVRKIPGITDAERKAIDVYAGDAQRINALIRNGRTGSATIRNLDRVLSRSTVSSDVELWRGLRSGEGQFGRRLTGDLTGFEFDEAAYLSTSANRQVAAEFAGSFGDARPIVMRLVAPSGTHALTLSDWGTGHAIGGQAEVLLERGLSLRVAVDHGVLAEAGVPQGIRLLDVEIVPK